MHRLTSLFPLIFLFKTHQFVCSRQAHKWILDIIWPLNQYFKLKKPKKLAKTSLNLKILEHDKSCLYELNKETYFSLIDIKRSSIPQVWIKPHVTLFCDEGDNIKYHGGLHIKVARPITGQFNLDLMGPNIQNLKFLLVLHRM